MCFLLREESEKNTNQKSEKISLKKTEGKPFYPNEGAPYLFGMVPSLAIGNNKYTIFESNVIAYYN